jgi:hypothetical protein
MAVAFGDPVYGDSPEPEQVARAAVHTRDYFTHRGLKFRRLPHSGEEAQAVADIFAPDSQALVGEQATEEMAKKEVGKARLVHLACHGYIDPDRPMDSALVLSLPTDLESAAENGFLQTYEVYKLRLNADLVTLSGCETGLGKELGGEGIMGLTRAFMYAGTPSVVVSLWKVSDESTAELMEAFYTELKQGTSKDVALQRAMQQLRSDPKYEHPYYWAPFVLVGDRRPVTDAQALPVKPVTEVPQIAEAGHGNPIAEMQIVGAKAVSRDVVANSIRAAGIRAGAECAPEAVEAARRSVLALGYYTDVTVKTDETPEGVCLTFTVREKQRLREIHVLGNTVFTEEELLEQMVLQPGMIADSITIRGDTARIQAFYQKRGYDAFVVNARLEFGELTVAISERRIRRIEIKGLETTKSDVVTETLGIKEGDIFDQGRVVTGLRRMLQLPGIEEAVWDLRHDPTDPQRYVVLVVDVQEKGGRNGEQ